MSLLIQHDPSAVLLVGTCGAYPGGPDLETVIACDKAGLSSGIANLGMGYVPRPPPHIQCSRLLAERAGLPLYNVLTVEAITTDPGLSEQLGRDWDVEHLETYGVALACHQHQIPFLAILGVANLVGPNAHSQWLANRSKAEQAACEAAHRLISNTNL